ncbi:MAG: 50S ribosomal protein L19 [Spirochaetales bacterium]|nr:50S ribosomal protein L19 [Spirochaetales bacterium]
MDIIKKIEAEQLRETSDFKVGDTVKVFFKIVEGKNERIQAYEGLVISMRHSGASESFTVRKLSYGVGVERVFPRNSPRIEKVEIVRYGKVRRAKLYYIREKVGKKAKIKELLGGRKPMGAKKVEA